MFCFVCCYIIFCIGLSIPEVSMGCRGGVGARTLHTPVSRGLRSLNLSKTYGFIKTSGLSHWDLFYILTGSLQKTH